MKIKPLVVASMSVLGLSLISYPVLAATTQTKHKHHQKHMVKRAEVAHHEYRMMGRLPVQPCPVVQRSCRVDTITPVMDSMTQNVGREVHAYPDWFQRIGVSGGLNFDAHWGNLRMGYQGENNRRLSVNDAYLNVTGLVNDWTKAFLSLSYSNPTGFTTNFAEVENTVKEGIYSSAYTNDRLNLEQAYVTFGNMTCSPFFVQLGKQFQDFGRYQIHPIERTMAQVLSETLRTSAKVGFLTPMGFHGSVYTFDSSLTKVGNSHSNMVYGAALGFDQQPCECIGYDVGVGYMSNFIGVNDVVYGIREFREETAATNPNPVGTYNNIVGAWNAYGDVSSGPFTIGARYTTAATHYNANTLSTVFRQNVNVNGAKPWAADITAGYGFNAWCRSQNVYVGYQTSGDAVNLLLPKSRWLVGYGIDVLHNTTLAAEFGHDRDYSNNKGGTGNSSNTIAARAAVRFG